MKVQMKENDWSKLNGKECLWWQEDSVGHIIFPSSPMSPRPVGFELRHTTNPREMDRLFTRIHEQERAHNERLIEKIYNQGREHYEALRSSLMTRLTSAGVSDAEKNIIRASLKLMNERDHKMQQNTVYGVSAMQESPEPIPSTKKVM